MEAPVIPKRSQFSNLLTALVGKKALSKDGLDWLIKSLDPFHDTRTKCSGMPDKHTGVVTVQELRKEVQIDPPAGLADGETWGFHVANLPDWKIDNTGNWVEGTSCVANITGSFVSGDLSDGSGTRGFRTAPFVISRVKGSIQTFPNSTWLTSETAAGTRDFLYPDYSSFYEGQSRIIGAGYELTYTGPEYYAAGACTSYCMNQTLTQTELVLPKTSTVTFADYEAQTGDAPVPSANCPFVISRLPPPTAADAKLIPGAVTRMAKDGAYVALRMMVDENIPRGSACVGRAYTYADLDEADASPSVQPAVITLPRFKGGSSYVVGEDTHYTPMTSRAEGSHLMPFHTTGCYFTGLNNKQNFTFVSIVMLERSPSPGNENMITLAHPSPDHDLFALELYKAIVEKLPPSVAVKENADGDFWDSVLSTASEVLPGVLRFFGPQAALIGSGLGAGANIIREVRNGIQARRK